MHIEVAKAKPTCMYCGGPARRSGRGEHIIPQAIGGGRTLRDACESLVCTTCNNGKLAGIDRELCSRSYLSVVASQEINAHLWQAWDVDRACGNVLVESRPNWKGGELLGLVCYPQMTFERTGPDIRGDLEETRQFGRGDFQAVLKRAVRRAFQRYAAGEKKSLHFERVDAGAVPPDHRLPPRAFTRHSIAEIARKIDSQSFIVRFVTASEKRFALWSMSTLDESRRPKTWVEKPGSRTPAFSIVFDGKDTLRALMKIALNSIAACAHNTPVNRETFKVSIRQVLGQAPLRSVMFRRMGFVTAKSIQGIRSDSGAHSFRIIYSGGHWGVLSSYFGGRIGSFVIIRGPSREEWACADIIAPLGSKDWVVETGKIIRPIDVDVRWKDLQQIAPSVRLQNSSSNIQIETLRI